MSNSEIKNLTKEDQLEFSATIKLICRNQNVTSHHTKPAKRYGHLSFMYKSKLYVQGGCCNEGKNQTSINSESKSNIYWMNLQKQKVSQLDDKKKKNFEPQGKWQIAQAKFTPAAQSEFQIVSYAAYCIFPHKKRLYMFGGSTMDGRTSNNLFRLDLDSLEWSKPEQKGTVPRAREDATMGLYTKNEKNYLVLAGGANYQTYDIFSDIHFYQIQTKYWFSCHNLSSNFIQPRLNPGICFNQNKIYVFGGYYLDSQHKKGYLNDLYEIEYALSIEKGRPYGRCFSRRLDQISTYQQKKTYEKPQKRCSTALLYYKSDFSLLNQNSNLKKPNKLASNWLVVLGGEKYHEDRKKIVTMNDLWIFSLLQLRWRRVPMIHDFKSRSSFSCVFDREINKFFVFGGISTFESILNDTFCIKFNGKVNQQKEEELKQELSNFQGANYNSFVLQEICNSMNFPFSGIGLILDNFINFQAQFCDISYHISKSKPILHNYIKFQSKVKFPLSKQALIQSFSCLKGGIRSYVTGTDKRIKAQMNRQNMSKQIGTNFLLGGLRIGGQIMFVNLDQETYEIQILIAIKCKQKIQFQETKKEVIINNYKIFDFIISKEQILSEDYFSTQLNQKNGHEIKKRKRFIESYCPEESKQRFKMLITQSINLIKKGEVKTIFYILKLRTVDGEECSVTTKEQELELFPDMFKNDLIYGDREIIKQIENSKIPVYQSLDVSLKTYVSYLYTTSQTQLTVSIHGLQKKPIRMQQYLYKMDQLTQSKDIQQIHHQSDYDCKILQIYYFPKKRNLTNLKKVDISFFANGVLIYQKSRLIKRHKINLGQYLYFYKIKSIQQEIANARHEIKQNQKLYNFTQLFGHIEIPQAIPTNCTKTDFIFPVMMQKIDQKLRLLQDQKIGQRQKIMLTNDGK